VLFVPILRLQEPSSKSLPKHSFVVFWRDLWDTLKNKTTAMILCYAIGMNAIAQMTISIATSDVQ
jgi:hypothetical protein